MFCKNCGSEINDNAVVCPKCGVATENLNRAQEPEVKKTNVCAILGFVFAILYWVFAYIPVVGGYISWILFIAGFVLSIVGIQNAKKKGQNLKGLAIAGLVICCVELVFVVMAIIGLITLALGVASGLI